MNKIYTLQLLFLLFMVTSCSNKEDNATNGTIDNNPVVQYADIDFSNWKVTLPVDENNNGSPDEYKPEDLINGGYRTLEPVKPFMYDDTTDESIVFYTYPGSTTTNSSYSRTELRELINPSNSRINWTLETGGTMKGRLKIMEVSKNETSSSEEYHKTIVMQIHGIISVEDVARLGLSSNNGPPLIKMRWIDGNLWVYKKSLVNEATSGDDLYDVSSNTWVDEKHNMGYVGFDTFDFRITASLGKIELQLNNETPFIYEDISLDKWPFQNYYKAGNYLGSTDSNAFSRVKYYSLSVTH